MSISKKLRPKARAADPNKPLSNTKNWYADRYQAILVQRNILAGVTFIALLATLISSYSVAQLTPLKSVQPFVIQVEDKTGVTKVIDPTKDKEIATSESLRQYFVTTYIRARESYNDLNYKENYATVRVMTDGSIFDAYRRFMHPDNPSSPVNLFARHSQRIVEFKSLTMVNEKSAQARLVVRPEGRLEQTGEMKPKNIVVWISFEFAKMELSAKERYINPLGFRVLSYSVDEELATSNKP